MDGERVVMPRPDDERGRETMNALMAAAAPELLGSEGETREHLAWLAYGLLRRAPTTLWKILKAKGRVEDAHELLNRMVDVQPSTAMATFAYREREKIGAGSGQAVRMAILSSYVAEPLIPFLDVECRRVGLSPSFYLGAFNQYAQEILSPSSELYACNP